MLTEEIILKEGLRVFNKEVSASSTINNRRYKSFYGVSTKVCLQIWDITSKNHPENTKLIHLLMALHFLKCYNTESVNAGIFHVDEKTFRKWTWIFVKLIAEAKIVSY
jgi:hypothetical protein